MIGRKMTRGSFTANCEKREEYFYLLRKTDKPRFESNIWTEWAQRGGLFRAEISFRARGVVGSGDVGD
jgi:hypothetical protein